MSGFDKISIQEDITIYKVFYNVVELMKLSYKDFALNFFYGYWPNVANEMVSNGRASKLYEFDKYPLIFLHADMKEDKDSSFDIYAEIDPKLYIIARTHKEYKFMQRYDEVFVKVLFKIYDILLNTMKTSGFFKLDSAKSTYPLMPHTKKDLYFIGSLEKDQNVLNEYVDAIELNFSKLQINNNLNF
jgi:hypothetical protein